MNANPETDTDTEATVSAISPIPLPPTKKSLAVRVLRAALEGAGFRVEHSAAGLYLWVTRDEDAWETVDRLARLGILVAPGSFYGPAGARHVRVALTASDAHVAAASSRLASFS